MLLISIAILAFYLAANLGANDVANSMGTSVGSKAITLKQAVIIAGILEFIGAVCFGRAVAETLGTEIINPDLFADTPQLLLLAMVAVLVSVGLWMQIATSQGLPVSSSHGVVGAIAGCSWVAIGPEAVNWSSIGTISIGWVLTPVVSGLFAAGLYSIVQRNILAKTNPQVYLAEWIPWLSAALVGVFGVIVLPIITEPINQFFGFPHGYLPLIFGGVAWLGITVNGWQQFNQQTPLPGEGREKLTSDLVESVLARFQVLSASCVAFAHGSNDVGNAIAPLAVIAYILSTGMVPQTGLNVPLWILIVGGVGIITGLAIWGKNVIATVGEGIIPLQPSSGFSAELATATTILLASRFGLPVSTSHALVGAVVGIGLVQNWRSVKLGTLKAIALAWVTTIPICGLLGAGVFVLLKAIFNG
ncbi:phosphate permease [Merismopedia glauca CCAP 1448/3]|uniref:Phosphate transporter n=2 Tax=Merismopedia TaxID=53402 RepID=A0A2T1C1P3_9CYAN|nr:phosphate permease [Merismopedia glauca CCAP 1448/3]